MDTTAVQRALVALGYPLKKFGADGSFGGESRAAMNDFQRDNDLPVTATADRATIAALQMALAPRLSSPASVVPADWMPAAQINRIIVHWTAGGHKASGLDRSHYHLLIDGAGELIRGVPTISLNDARGVKTGYAAHTLNGNTGSIGVSLCCMAGAVESPFKPGTAPMTRVQWEALPAVLAALCRRYSIPVTPRTVLSHAEVQNTLGIKQRGKWDISRLAFDPSVVGAKACGDQFRSSTSVLLG